MPKKKIYKVVRVVEECYSVTATTKEEALEVAAKKGDPYSVKVKSEKVIFINYQ